MKNKAASNSVHAFTLIELMISIAIVVVLMIGITKVFSLTANTAGATNQIASGIRDGRGAQTMFFNDLDNSATDMPFMVIRSGVQAAFRNKQDALSDQDGKPLTVDLNGDNVEGTGPGETYPATSVNNRNHRVDIFSFFARGLFPRETGNNGVYQANMSANEAWIWYGHLQLPLDSTLEPPTFSANTDPGASIAQNNPNNFYASQWVLGRVAILLHDPSSMVDRSTPPVTQTYIAANSAWPTFAYNSGAGTGTLQTSRYDLVGTTMSTVGQQLSDYIKLNPNANWWSNFLTGDVAGFGRFQANPQPSGSLDSYKLAQTAPVFINNCSQFIVEYAGDYLQQDTNPASPTYGQVENVYTQIDPNTTAATDGQTDFVVQWNDANGNGLIDAGAEQQSVRRSIRWYGLPRDTQGNGYIYGSGGGHTVPQITDVVPLRDVIRAGALTTIATVPTTLKTAMTTYGGTPFERLTGFTPVPSPNNPTLAPRTDYAATGNNGMQSNEYYECVWGPADPRPKMIRITMTIDDPTGKLPDGQTFQYVIQLH